MVVIQPIGAVPDGTMVIISGVEKLDAIDSPDAVCNRYGTVNLICRAAVLANVADNGKYCCVCHIVISYIICQVLPKQHVRECEEKSIFLCADSFFYVLFLSLKSLLLISITNWCLSRNG